MSSQKYRREGERPAAAAAASDRDDMQRMPMFKLVLVGDSGVGKTSLFMRVKEDVFSTDVTVGIESCSTVVDVDGDKVKFSVWDTAGVERFRTLTRNYYRNCHCVLLTCSISDKSTLDGLQRWNQDAEFYCKDGLKVILANKNDLEHGITEEQLHNFASTFDCRLISSVSAKTGNGIREMLTEVARLLLREHSKSRHALGSVAGSESSPTVDLHQPLSQQQQQHQQQQKQQPQQQQQQQQHEQQQQCCVVL